MVNLQRNHEYSALDINNIFSMEVGTIAQYPYRLGLVIGYYIELILVFISLGVIMGWTSLVAIPLYLLQAALRYYLARVCN